MGAAARTGMALVRSVSSAVAPLGLNLIGTVSTADYDAGVPPAHALAAIAPATQSVVVIGHGGGDFWSGFAARSPVDPGAPHPLDTYTRQVVEAALDGVVPSGGRLIFPFEFPAVAVSFQRLAMLAGLGAPSVLGVLVHPEFGPWIALRAALLLPEIVSVEGPAAGFDPCPTCIERACMVACPAAAVTPAGWSITRCGAHRARPDDTCAAGCHARLECVIGRAHRYPAAALIHHQAHARPAG
jgi:hypothetical protein